VIARKLEFHLCIRKLRARKNKRAGKARSPREFDEGFHPIVRNHTKTALSEGANEASSRYCPEPPVLTVSIGARYPESVS
jgi:hypothetical protein